MSFLTKVEAKITKSVHKPSKANAPIKYNQTNKSVKKPTAPTTAKKPKQPSKFLKAAESQGAKSPSNVNFMYLKQLLPTINDSLMGATPEDLTDPIWQTFFYEQTPEILTTLLLDLGYIEKANRPQLRRIIRQKLRK